MNRSKPKFLGIAGLLFIIFLFAFRAWDKHEMVRVTRIWGRLAPLPLSTRNYTAIKEGNMFTRAFRISFTAPVSGVERWLRDRSGVWHP